MPENGPESGSSPAISGGKEGALNIIGPQKMTEGMVEQLLVPALVETPKKAIGETIPKLVPDAIGKGAGGGESK